MRLVAAAVVLLAVLAGQGAHADTVALLPLDGEKRLEMYGQPVAAELGRAMTAAGLDVVVVGAKMDVPDTAQLIVDGTIKKEKGEAISLSIRVRDPKDGTTLETLPVTAASLRVLDKAAAELSSRVVPAVKTHLAALARAAQPVVDKPVDKPVVPTDRPPVVEAGPPLPPVHVAVMTRAGSPAVNLLEAILREELPPWARAHERAYQQLYPNTKVDETSQALTLVFDVLSFDVEPGTVPLAKARVRVRIIEGGKLRFRRVVRTDTIVGDKKISEHGMSARVAREVLAIVNAQLRRQVPGWR